MRIVKAAGILLGCALCLQALGAEVPVGDLIQQLPAQDAAAAAEISAKLVQAGPAGIQKIAALIVDPATIDPGKPESKDILATNAKARYALHGLALYVARPEAEAERKMFVETLASLLASPIPQDVKGFLIRQLQLAGGKESIEVLAGFLLAQKEMCEYAAQAMVAIGDASAVEALRDALPKAGGPNRLTVLQALGVLRDAKSVPAMLRAAADDNREVRLVALFALGNVGDPGAVDALIKASTPEGAYERAKAVDAVFLLAKRLVQADKKADAEKVYRHLWTTRTTPEDRHVRCGALRGLVAALGEKATDDVLAAMNDPSAEVRAVAADIVAAIPGDAMTARLLASLKDAPPAARVDTLGLLARRGDRGALTAALEAMKDADASVRKAAVEAAAAIGKDDAVPALIGALASADAGERDATRRALTLVAGEKATAAMVAALTATPPQVRRELLGILSGRGATAHLAAIFARTKDEDEAVRIAAIDAVGALGQDPAMAQLLELLVATKSGGERAAAEKAADAICRRSHKERCAAALLAALPKAELEARCALLRVLGGAGSPKGLDAIRAGIKDADPQAQEAALRGLARWPDATVAEELLGLAKSVKEAKHRVLALQGYIRLVGLESDRPPQDTVKMYAAGLAAAERVEEKKAIIGAVADVQDIAAVRLVVPCLEQQDVKAEAEVALIRLADRLHNIKGDELRQVIADALLKVAKESGDARRQKDAQKIHERWYTKKK